MTAIPRNSVVYCIAYLRLPSYPQMTGKKCQFVLCHSTKVMHVLLFQPCHEQKYAKLKETFHLQHWNSHFVIHIKTYGTAIPSENPSIWNRCDLNFFVFTLFLLHALFWLFSESAELRKYIFYCKILEKIIIPFRLFRLRFLFKFT